MLFHPTRLCHHSSYYSTLKPVSCSFGLYLGCRKGQNFCVACEAKRHIGITLSGICLSGSHSFLVVTHSYVSQATHAFLGMLPLFSSLNVGRSYGPWHTKKALPHYSYTVAGISTKSSTGKEINSHAPVMEFRGIVFRLYVCICVENH